MTRLIDCHSHTALSGHGQGTVADQVRRAAQLGLHTYCMTEHMGLPESMDPHHEDSVPPMLLEGYCRDVLEQRELLRREGSDMQVVLGAELDWLGSEHADELTALSSRFEYTLGSIHFLDGLALDNPDAMQLWDRLGVDGVWQRYVDEWLSMANSSVPFCAFSHLDLPKVFGLRPHFDVREAYAEMADALRRRDGVFEINTAGWRKKVGEQYPCDQLISMLLERDVPVTVGADAHKPDDVAAGVNRAYELLRRMGASHVFAPTPQTMATGEWTKLEL